MLNYELVVIFIDGIFNKKETIKSLKVPPFLTLIDLNNILLFILYCIFTMYYVQLKIYIFSYLLIYLLFLNNCIEFKWEKVTLQKFVPPSPRTYFRDKYWDGSENFLPLRSYPDYDLKVVKSAILQKDILSMANRASP